MLNLSFFGYLSQATAPVMIRSIIALSLGLILLALQGCSTIDAGKDLYEGYKYSQDAVPEIRSLQEKYTPDMDDTELATVSSYVGAIENLQISLDEFVESRSNDNASAVIEAYHVAAVNYLELREVVQNMIARGVIEQPDAAKMQEIDNQAQRIDTSLGIVMGAENELDRYQRAKVINHGAEMLGIVVKIVKLVK